MKPTLTPVRGHDRVRVLVVGGGVAALELMLALRELAGELVSIELLCPERELAYKPLAVLEPFGAGEPRRFDLGSVTTDCRAHHRLGALAAVDAERRRVIMRDGGEVEYDVLVVATGAVFKEALRGALTFAGPASVELMRDVLADLAAGTAHSAAFAVPSRVSWPLPAYELALMTATQMAARQVEGVRLTVVTPEEAPLGLFGPRATKAIRSLLDERGIELRNRCYPALALDGELVVTPGERVKADRIVALPRLEGPRIPGLPHNDAGFIPVNLNGRVEEVERVFAAGDVTTFPIKQGGLASQQADAAAEYIAAAAGAELQPTPFRPVLRGLLLTGRTPSYFRTEVGAASRDSFKADVEPLWWPPSKIAGGRLSRYLATVVAAEPPSDTGAIRVEVDDLESMLA